MDDKHEHDRVDKLLRRMPMFSERLDKAMGRDADRIPDPLQMHQGHHESMQTRGRMVRRVFSSRRGF